jgi:hypothetical protein
MMTSSYTDSRSAIQGINKYLQKNPIVQLVQSRIANSNKNIQLCWVPSHVGIQQNEQVDALARDVVLATDPDPAQIPRSDYKCIIRNAVKHRWSNIEGNNYREISDLVTPLPHALSSNRSWSITLTRLRIGHSTLTHGHLMDRSYQPYCDDCLVPLTIKHLLIECPSLIHERIRYFNTANPTMKTILEGPLCSNAGPLHSFLSVTDNLNSF